jgi:hypothetical protein
MKQAVALVVVLAMSGTPFSTFLCVERCLPASSPVSTPCHDQMGRSAGISIHGIAGDSCLRLFAFSPYLREETLPTPPAVDGAGALQAFRVATFGEAQLASVRDGGFEIRHAATSPVVLRL